MQVNNQAVTSQMIAHEKPLELKQGEIYRATVKERTTNNEAVIQIRGREIQVKFEGGAPLQDRVTVQINGQIEQQVQVRAISEASRTATASTPQTEAANINQALRSLGVSNPSQELRQAAQIVLDKGVPLNRESVQDLRNFIDKEKGTVEQRLNTVQAVANKRLEVTTNHLRSVHEALSGRPLNEVLTSIAKEIDPNFRVGKEQTESRSVVERPVSEQVREVREQVQRESNVQRSIEQVRSEVVNNPRVEREVARQVERAVDEARALHQGGREVAARERMVQALQTAEREVARTESRQAVEPRVVESRQAVERPVSDQVRQPVEPRVVESRPVVERPVSEQIRNVREEVQREPNVQRSIEQVRTQIVENPRVGREFARQVERAVDEARALQQSGREVAARDRLVQALQTAEREFVRTESRQAVEPRVVESRPVVERPVSEQVRNVREQVQREPNVQRSIEQIRSQVVENPRVGREFARQVERAVDEARTLQQSGREVAARDRMVQALQTAEREITRTESRQAVEPRVVESRQALERPVSEQVRDVREQVQREPNVQRSIEQVRSEVVNNPRVDREVARQVERAVDEARALQQGGREVAARDRMVQALQTAEREIARTETRQAVEPRVVESRPVQERPVSEQVRDVREQVQREPNVQRSIEQVRSEVVNNPRVDREVASQLERAVEDARILQQTGRELAAKDRLVQALQTVERTLNNQQATPTNQSQQEQQLKPSEQLKQMQGTVQKEGDFQKAVNLLNNQIERAPFDLPIKEQLQKAITDASKLQEEGRELAARQQLMQAFTAIERPVAKLDQTIQPEMQQYMMNETFQTQQLSSKDFIVQTVTEKLAKAQSDFKTLQREITRNLDNIQRLTEAFKSQAASQVKPLLETTIKKLDHAILKSEMMLLTDMKTEKRLMQASSQLAEAKKLLTKGNYQEANKIVQEVKSLIEKLDFKPSDTKVKHFITKEEQNLTSRTGSQQLLQQFDEMTRRSAMQEPSARQAFELVRGLGLNRDSEVAQMLASGRQGDSEPNQNMKQALMQLMKMEEEQGRVSQQTSQALANITGQQLLSKSDNSNLQSMFLSIPFLLQDEVKNLQVFVNSRNDGQQVDWENCNLYFLIETKKLGEVGILVTSTDRNLSLTIKNDQPFFKERIEPLAEVCKEKLKEVGYNIASLNFTKLHAVPKPKVEKAQAEEQTERMTPTFTEKGFDFKI
ncbi:hypothetical protein AWH56_025840 [Anaerobacillus isosaccharinicus]|uniref:Flagellar hook-length control protein-like C-terminal domain-containing protein n=1 Tax=Anaerobacillus isosaccharinicus TaxID=1532552 RepID=A0A1S2MEK0_9BACI|nr:hypothetical protein [Anaerobacillus isosaccharinicus]MBA5585671.1 hypothetical protein [Anaerobacillus isosaccharinicus]QOY36021.1 hypothetical protein AWH56_025840 [Anaerobacillus isosaccharinicus]